MPKRSLLRGFKKMQQNPLCVTIFLLFQGVTIFIVVKSVYHVYRNTPRDQDTMESQLLPPFDSSEAENGMKFDINMDKFDEDPQKLLSDGVQQETRPLPSFDSMVTNYHRHDFLNDKPFDFDKRFKNPCWYEGETLKCLPYFLIIGMRKSGTTSLFRTILNHPESVDWGGKETQFFGHLQNKNEKGLDDIYTYVDMFATASRRIQEYSEDVNYANADITSKYIFGDGSVCTLFVNYDWRYFPGNEFLHEPNIVSLDYVHHFLPDAKIIIVFRDPVDRLYSEYYFIYGKLFKKDDITPETFHNQVTELVDVYNTCFQLRPVRECVYDKSLRKGMQINIQMGIYYIYWLELLRLYNREQILVLPMKTIDSIDTVRTVFSFLDMSPLSDEKLRTMVPDRYINPRLEQFAQLGPMLNSTRRLLAEFYRPFNQHMSKLMNDSFFLFE